MSRHTPMISARARRVAARYNALLEVDTGWPAMELPLPFESQPRLPFEHAGRKASTRSGAEELPPSPVPRGPVTESGPEPSPSDSQPERART